MEVSKGASIAIIVVVVLVVAAAGYYMVFKPKSTSVSAETREKYMQMRQNSAGPMGSGGPRPMMGSGRPSGMMSGQGGSGGQ